MTTTERYPCDFLSLPDGSALVTGEDCACGQYVTWLRGVRWNADDTPHECPAGEEQARCGCMKG